MIYLIVVSGRYDILAEVVCRDHAHLLQFLTQKLYAIDGVRELRIVHAFEDHERDLFLAQDNKTTRQLNKIRRKAL